LFSARSACRALSVAVLALSTLVAAQAPPDAKPDASAPQSAAAPPFYLKSGDTVVFYGDSITEQNYYNQSVELYTVTRFPSMRVHFYGEGVGGDRVTGGSGGPIDQRLARDVFPHKPTVVTIMLGMNDGGYKGTTDEILSAYTKGYEHILDSLHVSAPGARITLLGPSPYDDVTRTPTMPGGYNAVMQHFAEVDRDLARRTGATFIDLNPGVVAEIEKASALDPEIAKLILPDRVHPDPVAHWVMAESLLQGWNAPALVSSVTVDAGPAMKAESINADVTQIAHDGAVLRWTTHENALPLPFNTANATTALLFKLTAIQEQLNQEMLRVTGLAAGLYSLKIDDTSAIGPFSADDLARGINLAGYATPMRRQAERVSWLVRDRDEANYIHLRMAVRNYSAGPAGQDTMDGFERSLEDAIYETAAPVPHTFALSPAAAPAAPAFPVQPQQAAPNPAVPRL
jgi:lysophospholipase L1-like esterase